MLEPLYILFKVFIPLKNVRPFKIHLNGSIKSLVILTIKMIEPLQLLHS